MLEEKMIAVFQIDLDKLNNRDNASLIRNIHKSIPRKLVVSEIIDTVIDNEKATCTVRLKRAPMISVDEIKSYIQTTGERTTMKRFLNWLESLK